MSHNSTRWQVEAYEHALKLAGPRDSTHTPTPPERESDDIQSFSRDSRRRLIKKILRLERSRLSDGSFLTLTYHEDWTLDREDLQQDLGAFLQAMRRQYPDSVYIWRIEFQKRGAPHFHLMIWRAGGREGHDLQELAAWVKETWTRISAQDSAAHAQHGTDTRRISSWREAMGYVSKYVADTGKEGEVDYSGRRWGASQSLPTAPVHRFHCSETAAHIIRRLCRKLVSKTLGSSHPFHAHLKQAKIALVGMDPRTVTQMIDYAGRRTGGEVCQGPPPDVGSDLRDSEEWIQIEYPFNLPPRPIQVPGTPLSHA